MILALFFLPRKSKGTAAGDRVLSLQKTGIPHRKNPETGVYLQELTALMPPE